MRNDSVEPHDLTRVFVGVNFDRRRNTAFSTLPGNGFKKSIDALAAARKNRSVVIAERLKAESHLCNDRVSIVSEIANQAG